MHASSPNQEFLAELTALEQRFNALQPELELTVRDPALDLEGYVVVHSTLASRGGPLGRIGKGGTRITPGVTLEEISMLARTMTLKNAAAGLALGGAKSGLRGDPDEPGFEQKYRRFVTLVKPILAENGGIFGGFGFDIGGRPIHPRWACEELGSRRSFTGKPLDMGGTDYDREGIAGLGVATAAKTALDVLGRSLQNTSFSVQGLGAMGGAVVRYFSEYGAKLAYVSDPRIGGTFEVGTPSHDLLTAIACQDFATVREKLQGQPQLPLDDVLYREVDVLFPCAVQNVITADNVERICAHAVVEAANNPCSEEARARMFERGIANIPDFIANPGGVIAAYVEMLSEVEPIPGGATAKVERAKTFTRERIAANVRRMMELSASMQVGPALAGRYVALTNIFEK
jgi:glutamate dehydrogenase (NAD(P)+)